MAIFFDTAVQQAAHQAQEAATCERDPATGQQVERERGRTEWVGARGRPIQEWNRDGYSFVVYALTMKFRQPAALGDTVEVVTSARLSSPYRAVFAQRVGCRGAVAVEAEVELVCLGPGQKLRRFPDLGLAP